MEIPHYLSELDLGIKDIKGFTDYRKKKNIVDVTRKHVKKTRKRKASRRLQKRR